MHSYIVLILCLLLALIQVSLQIKCFQCNSALNETCANLTKTDTNSSFYRECDTDLPAEPFCRKTHFTLVDKNKTSRVIRTCGWEVYKERTSHCLKSDTDFIFQKSCQCFTDGCNDAPYTTPMVLPVLVLPLAVAITTRLY